MNLNPSDVKYLLELGRAQGLRRLKFADLEVEFGPAPGPAEAPRTVPIGEEHGVPTEDELLMWSAPGGGPDIDAGGPPEP